MNSTHITSTRRGFTLIEMLVVIAIIAILAGLLFPAIGKAMQTAKKNQAGADARSIAGAITMFYNDYGYLPDRLEDQGLQPFTGTNWTTAAEDASGYFTEEVSKRIIQVLIAEPSGANSNHQLNPKRKVYLSMDSVEADGTLLDPWGQQYLIKLDRDLDNKLEFFSRPEQHRTRAVVVSRGADREMGSSVGDALARDNVANVDISN